MNPATVTLFPFTIHHNFLKDLDMGTEMAQASATRTFYVIDRGHVSNYLGAVSSSGSNWFKTINEAFQFATVNDAARALAKLSPLYEGRNAKIVRVDRTTVPGKLIPATEKRNIIPALSPASDKWAVRYKSNGKGTPFYIGAGDTWTFFGDELDKALLFDTESAALRSLQNKALDSAFSFDDCSLVRVRVTSTPATTAPDTVTETLTVLE